MNTQNNQQLSRDDEIDLRELFAILWKGKWIIIGVTFLFAIASVAYALYLPNEYKATALVQPNDSSGGGGLGQLAGQFGGLASLAGIDLGGGDSSDAVIAMEVIQSWGFAEQFIEKHKLAVPLFAAKEWNQSSNKLVLDESIYDESANKWTRPPPKGKTSSPTSWELYEEYKERVDVTQDDKTGLVTISVTFFSPEMSKQWVDWLVQDINHYMKKQALKEANKSIKYLEEQISETRVAEIRTVFSELIQEQHKTKMLAQVLDEYVFKTISIAKIPEEKEKPRRAIIAISGTLLGGLLSVLVVIIFGLFNWYKRKQGL